MSKYYNKKTTVDGITFDSKLEAERYLELKLLVKAKEISELQLQVPFELIPSYKYNNKTIRKCVYRADFVYPSELLEEIGMDTQEDKAISEMLNVASNLNYYSREETEGGTKFEYAIQDAFNLFVDVEAERIAGAGNPDIECLYYPNKGDTTKFDIEAKARKTKLVEINPRRLKTHRQMIGSKYTVIVAPNYPIGVIRDIDGEESVIIKSATLANYFYQSILKYGRAISYTTLNEIITSNKDKIVQRRIINLLR